eukprot:9673296-Alexandrium_andersonii.AAC.1
MARAGPFGSVLDTALRQWISRPHIDTRTHAVVHHERSRARAPTPNQSTRAQAGLRAHVPACWTYPARTLQNAERSRFNVGRRSSSPLAV